MKFFFKLSILLTFFSVAWSNEVTQDKEATGVLIEYVKKGIVKNKNFQSLVKQHKLNLGNHYPNLKIWEVNAIQLVPIKELKLFCKKVQEIQKNIYCEINLKLKPYKRGLESVKCDIPSLIIEEKTTTLSNSIKEITETCELIPRSKAPHQNKGLSTFWAQEYTGADLLRQQLQLLKLDLLPSNLVDIWDTNDEYHGNLVSNLISGESASSTLPFKNPNNFKNLSRSSDYFQNYQYFLGRCSSKDGCTQFINNSMNWLDSPLIGKVVSKLAENGTIFIAAAGNDSQLSDQEMRKQASKDNVILVSSVDQKGNPSEFTSYAPELSISAPSDNLITSFDKHQRQSKFGGTSGAAPQVTAALSAFSLITGYDLDVKEAKRLLEQTAIAFPNLPTPNNLGDGILNSYRIGEVAFRLKEKCSKASNSKQCIRGQLILDDTFNFEDQSISLLNQAKSVFPKCMGKINSQEKDCTKRKELFKNLREQSLLNPQMGTWNLLACLHKEEGYLENAEYYIGIAQSQKRNQEELMKSLFKSTDINSFAKYLISPNNSSLTEKVKKHVLNNISSFSNADLRSFLKTISTFDNGKFLEELKIESFSEDFLSILVDTVTYTKPRVSNSEEIINKILLSTNVNNKIFQSILTTISYDDGSIQNTDKILDKILESEDIGSYTLSRAVDVFENSNLNLASYESKLRKLLDHKLSTSQTANSIFNIILEYPPSIPISQGFKDKVKIKAELKE